MRSTPPENSSLLDLPLDIMVNKLALELESVRRLNLVSKHFSFFNMGTPLRMAYHLLNCIDKADWAGAAAIVQLCPEAMFVSLSYKGLNGQSEHTTAVMRSFKLIDTAMSRLLWQAAQVNPHYVAQYLLQSNLQNTVISMDELTKAYQDYAAAHQRWLQNQADEVEKCKIWDQLGQVQMRCLPVHMLKAWCAVTCIPMAFNWANIQSLKKTKPGQVFVYLYDRTKIDFDGYLKYAASGYVLVRGLNNPSLDLLVFQQSGERGGHLALSYDHRGLMTLYNLKLNEQIAFRRELEVGLQLKM